ncbi:MAG: serine hydrolase [Bacteroidota bacterium]
MMHIYNFRKFRLPFSSLIGLFIVSLLPLSAQNADQFRLAAQEALEAFDAPGFAVGIIQDGEVVLSEGFGTRTIGQEEPVDGNTLFAIASNTKAFIATAIARLHEEGKLDLDEPVQTYLPYFQLYDEYVSQHTTVRDLLCHRVGLGTFSGDAIWYKSEKSAEEIIRQIRHLPQAYEWRGGYGYTNLMFITAGEVIRSVTGKSWAEYVRDNFLDPLMMERTQTSVSPLSGMDNVATPHISHRNNLPIPMAPWEASGAAGGLISSTNDMLKWLGAQLDFPTDLQVAGRRRSEAQGIFPAAARRTCMRPHNPIGGDNFYSAGLGWFLYQHGGEFIVTHGGGYDGMYSNVIMIPGRNLGIVVLSNSMTGVASTLARYIRDSYLGLDTEGWLETATAREANNRAVWQEKVGAPGENRVLGTSPSLKMDEVVGVYHDPLYGEVQITIAEDGRLQLYFQDAPALTARLDHWHYDTYWINWQEDHAWFNEGTLRFVIDNNRQVTGIRFHVPNDDIFFEEIEMERVGEE